MSIELARSGKRRWADKSLSNVFHLDLLASLWPEARFLLLHRHCMDFIEGGLTASPWGLSDYGFSQVAQMSPTNSVTALAAYWVDRTQRLLEFEQRSCAHSLRLRYEDLVLSTVSELSRIFSAAGLEPVDRLADLAFDAAHDTLGPADHTIWYSSGIHRDTIGNGARIPPALIGEPLRGQMNALLTQLGYPTVDEHWGAGEVAPLRIRPQQHDRVTELRVVENHRLIARHLVDLHTLAPLSVADDMAGELEPVRFLTVIEQRELADLCGGRSNIGRALRQRSVRWYGPLPRAFGDEHEIFMALATYCRQAGEELPSSR